LSSSSKRRALRLTAGVVVAGAASYGAVVTVGAGSGGTAAPPAAPVERPLVAARSLAPAPAGARMLVRVADPLTPRMDGPVYELDTGASTSRRAGRLRCKRVAASPTGGGLCLALSGDGKTYEGIVFDAAYAPRRHFRIDGVPDRARVSPDGRLGAFTAFDAGSSRGYFADLSGFSVSTRVVDMRTGRALLDLGEELAVVRGDRSFRPGDAQYWGVTFTGGDRFLATMATSFAHYLIEGDVSARRARVIGRRVECPAVSPDGRRVAYKRRIGYSNRWRLHVRDLRTGRDVALAERRSIDDQPEWWGDDLVLYSDDRSVFVVPADGSGSPRLVARHATSATLTGGAR
jgi:hypothetical protein